VVSEWLSEAGQTHLSSVDVMTSESKLLELMRSSSALCESLRQLALRLHSQHWPSDVVGQVDFLRAVIALRSNPNGALGSASRYPPKGGSNAMPTAGGYSRLHPVVP
jgi:hypothetical protein